MMECLLVKSVLGGVKIAVEHGGRGSGIENEVDKSWIGTLKGIMNV